MLDELTNNNKIALYQDVLEKGINLRLKVTGRSMAPFLTGGEILTIKKAPCMLLHTGDLIFYKTRRGFPILHRIIRKKFSGDTCLIQTKGDSIITPDEPVTESSILGKVCRIERTLKTGRTKCIDMESPQWRGINYLLALTGLAKSKAYVTVARSALYASLRSIIKSLHP